MEQKQTKGFNWIGAIILFIVVLVAIKICTPDSKETKTNTETASSTKDLKASIYFNGTQITIINSDSFDWTNVKLELNSHGLKSGYITNVSKISAGETIKVGVMVFAKKDGERFNPITYKVLSCSIFCDVPGGNGFYLGQFQN